MPNDDDVSQWAQAGAQALQRDTVEQVRASVSQALPVNPDKEAETRRYAAAAVVPLDVARRMPDEVKQQAQMSAFDAEQLARKFPNTAKWISVPDNAKLAHDDVPATTAVEQHVTALAGPPAPERTLRTVASHVLSSDFWTDAAKYLFSANDNDNNLTSDMAGAARALSGKIGNTLGLAGGTLGMGVDAATSAITGNEHHDARDMAFGYAKMYGDQADAVDAKPSEFHNKLVQSAASLGLQLPMMLATGGGGAAPEALAGAQSLAKAAGTALVHGAKSMAIPALNDAVQTMRQVFAQTGDLNKAALAGQAQYATSTAGGVIPLSAPGGLAKRLLTGAGVGTAQGELSRQAMNIALPDTMQHAFNWEDLALSGVTGSLLSGAMGPGAHIDRMAATRAFNDAFDAAHAEHQNQQLVDLAKAAAASKLRERDPQAFKQFVKDTADASESLQDIHIEAHQLAAVLQAHGVTGDELHQTMPEVAKQMDEALGEFGPTNGLIKIPVEDFATHIAGSELEKPLMEHLRVGPEGGTVAESAAFKQAQVEDLKAQAEKLTAAHEQDTAYQASMKRVVDDIQQRLQAIGMKVEMAQANGSVLAAFYQVHADQMGVLPHEFAERYPVSLSNKALQGLDQRAYHGTPHRGINQFDTAHIGRGEGNQAFGWGLYFAGKKEVAEHYRKTLGEGALSYAGKTLDEGTARHTAADLLWGQQGDKDGAKDDAEGFADSKQIKKEIDALDFRKLKRGGQLYEVEIPEDSDMLHFDKPITSQPAKVKQILKDSGLWKELKDNLSDFGAPSNTRGKLNGENIYAYLAWKLGSEKAASEKLLALGIPGMKYPGGMISGVKNVGHNYVIFHGDAVKKTGELYQSETLADTIEVDGKQRPTTNSKGQPIAATEEGVRNFWRWFGDSAVTERAASSKQRRNELRPLAVYHGTRATFDSFAPVREGNVTTMFGDEETVTRHGIFFAETPEFADTFAKQAGAGSANVVPVYLKIENPLYLDEGFTDEVIDELAAAGLPDEQAARLRHRKTEMAWAEFDDEDGAAMVAAIRAAGYDGALTVEPGVGVEGEDTQTVWVALDPEQIKSAIGNSGEFDPANPSILRQESRGTYSPSTKTLSLLKTANLSTFQHELGHFFLDTMAHLAAQPDAPASVKADMQTVLKWFGVPDLDSWHQMSLDEQRASHEKFATGWETYLMKGQAPSLELRTVFSRFRAWMLRVYTSLKGAPGDFTPEVKGVFDRMIASEDAIHQAELARKYMPLFDSPEKSGMSPEDWAAYQAQGRDPTEQAIAQLIGKTMKDMAWQDRLRTASLKSVTEDAREKRKAIEREVRPQVMSQPVYRAWTFLTGRGEKDQRAAEAESKKVEGVDVHVDSLLTAIAKLGGIDRESAKRHAGVHPDFFKTESGVFGKPIFRKTGGRSADDMLQALADHHYMPLDEHGRPSMADLEDKINEELSGNHQYSMAHDYGRGDAPLQELDGTQVTYGKLRTSDLHEAFGAGKDAAWRRLSDLRMTSDKRGIAPGIVADMFGFPDVQSLVKALTEAEPPRSVIEGMTDQRMLEEHGELSSPEAIARTADELVQNEVRARFVATELRALKKATGSARDMAQAAKEVAERTIGDKRVRDINERQFVAAETRSAGQAERAMAKGDTEGAAVAKRDQLLNMELARAARKAKDEVAKSVDYLAKFDKPSVRDGIDLEYRDQIDALLDRYDLRKSVSGVALDKREALLDFVERMTGEGYKPAIPEKLLDEARRTHYKDMPFAEFQGLVDAVKSIEHLGKLKTRLQDLQESRAINDLADEVKATAAKMPQTRPDSNRGLTRMQAAWVQTKAWGRSAEASLLKMEQMLDWLDARNPNGTLNRVVFRRLSEAGVHENNLMTRVKAEIDKLITSHLADVTKEKGKIYVAAGLIDAKTGQPQRFTTKEMLMLAGNMGNESNAAKVAKGEKWDQAHVWDFLHKNMTKAHWDFVAGMGRVLESLWPEKLAMDRRLGNTSPEKIQPRPFDTPHGRYDGWYWPMMYDPSRSQDVAERGAKKADALFENTYSTGNTDTGRMNTRNENYARPVLLDLDALPRMIREEIHDVSHREAVIDADRFLSHPTVRKAIIGALSQEHYDQLRPWLQAIANDGKLSNDGGRGMEFFNSIAREARTRATMVGLGFRLTTAMVHGMSAGAESVAELGGRWMASGLKDFVDPRQWAANKDFIFERSGEMRNRMNEVDRDIREHLREIDTHLMDPTTGAMARGADHMRAHAYSMIAGLDMASALPTWMGAYKKAMTPVDRGGLGMGEQGAVYFADKTVRNAHGGTGVKDMARVQRGSEFQKLFTMFYTFWNHNINRITDTARLVASAEHRAALKEANHWSNTQLAATVIMRTLVYTIGVQVLHSLVHPPKDGEEADSWLKWFAKEMTAAAFGGIPIARDLSAHFISGKDYSVTPAASLVDMIGNTGTDMANLLTGQEASDKWLKHTLTTAGAVFNLPLGQPASSAQFLWDVGAGKQYPDGAGDWFKGLMHGTLAH